MVLALDHWDRDRTTQQHQDLPWVLGWVLEVSGKWEWELGSSQEPLRHDQEWA